MIESLVKKSLRKFVPYVSARSLYKKGVFLDANENPFDTGLNRYPDPAYIVLRKALAGYVGVNFENIFVGSGSDEILSLIGRLLLDEKSIAIGCSPTYGMYKVVTEACGAKFVDVPLKKSDFQIDRGALYREMNVNVKIIFLCSPNNPTGNLIQKETILDILDGCQSLVVVDEAYLEFSSAKSLAGYVKKYPNLVVLRTFSKAWGLAGARVGYCIANGKLVDYLNKLKLPYNLNVLSERVALSALKNISLMKCEVGKIIEEREKMRAALEVLGLKVAPSDSNFLFIRFKGAEQLVKKIAERFRIIIRAFPDGFRISIGLPEENFALINTLKRLI